MTACGRCGDRKGHVGEPVAAAACALEQATTAAIRARAAELGADQVAAADLLAHLRTVYGGGDGLAFRAAAYVLDLGWRPTVGGSVGETVVDPTGGPAGSVSL
jgi:hypothetical protein